ncbi:hypothetical protein ACT1UF_03800 [Clostridium septicum]|uniref:Uncharacterized protein n=1 Tax=Clostridium septicum TaxID=1504 RepID=A0ABY5B1M8_CLOSE|nr:hypothetical protein [Clostridium septicum]USS01572.1 hypothetical protein NH397_03795 [Clostridium septicum]
MSILRKIAEVCMNEEKLKIILNSKNEKEIQEVL